MKIKNVAIVGSLVAVSFLAGFRLSSFIWKRGIDKMVDKVDEELDRDSKKRCGYYHYDEPLLSTEEEAVEVLTALINLYNSYGIVSVADLYDLCGITNKFTDNQYGWNDLENVKVVMTLDRAYTLDLPEVQRLSRKVNK